MKMYIKIMFVKYDVFTSVYPDDSLLPLTTETTVGEFTRVGAALYGFSEGGRVTWGEAWIACTNHGSNLLVVESQQEWALLFSHLVKRKWC